MVHCQQLSQIDMLFTFVSCKCNFILYFYCTAVHYMSLVGHIAHHEHLVYPPANIKYYFQVQVIFEECLKKLIDEKTNDREKKQTL